MVCRSLDYVLVWILNRGKSNLLDLLRHTRAMHLYQDGVPLSYVKEVLGHSNINTTSIYASADLEMLRKVMEPLDMDLPTASPMPRWDNEKERLMKLAGLM